MKDSEILRRARARIERGHETFICIAIGNIADNKQMLLEEIPLVQWVESMLGGISDGYGYKPGTYENWLAIKTGKFFEPEDYKQGRLAWLDWMIEYCEKEGQDDI